MPDLPRGLMFTLIAVALGGAALMALWLREPSQAARDAAAPATSSVKFPAAAPAASAASFESPAPVRAPSQAASSPAAVQGDPFKAFLEEAQRRRTEVQKSPFGTEGR